MHIALRLPHLTNRVFKNYQGVLYGLCSALLLQSYPTSRAEGPQAQRPTLSPVANRGAAQDPIVEVRSEQIKTAKALERLRAQLEEWGTVNVSEPLLYRVNGQFNLGADADFPKTSTYIEKESTNINAAVSQLTQMVLRAAGAATLATNQLPATAPAPTAAETTEPTPRTAPQVTTPDIPESKAKDFLTKPTFEALGGLLTKDTPNAIPIRQAVISGTGDKLTELLIRNLANPSDPADGRKLYLAIFQVTCNPGWRTTKNYMADLHVMMEYGEINEGKVKSLSLSSDGMPQPTVVATLPLTDAQNMELKNGQRELYSILLSLSASGAIPAGNAAGRGVLDYINSYQKDSASRNAMPVVNSYSTGGTMGFRFAPSFLAMDDPAKRKSKAANKLIPNSFPVLAIISMDPRDVVKSENGYGKESNLAYDHLVTRVSFRWLLRDRRISLWPWDWSWPKRREDEMRRTKNAIAEETAFASLSDSSGKLLKYYRGLASDEDLDERDKDQLASDAMLSDSVFQLHRSDYFELYRKLYGKWTFSRLPTDLTDVPSDGTRPVVTRITPEMIDDTIDNVLVIEGRNFEKGVTRVVLGGRDCELLGTQGKNRYLALYKAGKISTQPGTVPPPLPSPIMAQVPPAPAAPAKPDHSLADVVVISKMGAGSAQVKVKLPKQKDPPDPTADDRKITLTRDAEGRITTLEFEEEGGLSGDKLIDAIARILAPVEPAAKSATPKAGAAPGAQ